jgi:hypothetical protein
MAIREFADSKGVSWRVWNTTPSRAAMYADELREGWLTFESGTELRRLAPIPGSWEEVLPIAWSCSVAWPRKSRTVSQTTTA